MNQFIGFAFLFKYHVFVFEQGIFAITMLLPFVGTNALSIRKIFSTQLSTVLQLFSFSFSSAIFWVVIMVEQQFLSLDQYLFHNYSTLQIRRYSLMLLPQFGGQYNCCSCFEELKVRLCHYQFVRILYLLSNLFIIMTPLLSLHIPTFVKCSQVTSRPKLNYWLFRTFCFDQQIQLNIGIHERKGQLNKLFLIIIKNLNDLISYSGNLIFILIRSMNQSNEDVAALSVSTFSRQQDQFTLIASLQKILKNEYFLLKTESEHKNTFEKKMQNTLFSYYRSTVNLGESVYQTIIQEKSRMDKSSNNTNSSLDRGEKEKSMKYEQQKRLLQDEGFGDVYTFVKEVVLSLSKDPYLMMILIQKNQNTSNIQGFTSLAKVIISCMYQNIVDDDVFNKDLLKIIVYCIKTLIEDKKHYFDINLQQKGFIQVILSEITQRNDIKHYSKQICKNTLLEIAKIDHAIDFKIQQDQSQMLKTTKLEHKQSTKYNQSPLKPNKFLKLQDKKSKIKLYSNGLRSQDQKIRKKSIVKRKYRNCISDELLNKLNINEQILFPCFYSKQDKQLKLQQQINIQLGRMLNRSQSKIEASVGSDIILMKNIVLIFFNDVFKMLYSMPPLIRISSKILFKYLNTKFNIKNSLYVVADFIINFWLVSSLNIDITMVQSNKLNSYLQKNVEQISIIIKSIVKDNYKDIHPAFIREFNILLTNLKLSIANYIHEVININDINIDALCQEVQMALQRKAQDKKPQLKNIKSYCVCINMVDLKRLMDMIRNAEKELSVVNQKLFKRVQRIQLMSDGKDIFGDKREKLSGKLYKASKAYALFTELSLPSHLSTDYYKTYNNAFKNSKCKNLLRQVLLSLNDIETYQQFYTSNGLQDFFESLQFGCVDQNLYEIDHIPLKLKLQYLKILCRKFKLIDIVKQLNYQTENRFQTFKQTWQSSKQCYLRAITSINFQNNKLNIKENYIRDQIKRRKLQQFFLKHQIKLCLTSPKTRQKQIVLKTNLMKQVIEQYKQRLWLQNQSKCIHTALNLDFIKSLTGQPQKQKVKYESHINSIMKFSQILCSLPEVKERFNMIEDNIGIKQVFFDFIQYIRDLIRTKQTQYAILLQNIEWLQQNIQLKISKKLFDKLYPKYALYDDIALYLRLKTLDWISFDHLKIDQSLRNWKVWQVAATHLRQIDKLRTAAQKLHCIEQTNKIIVNSYTLMSKSQKPASADDLYPLFILVLIKAAPKRLISSISFIQSFASQSKLLSKQGYCFTQLKAALQFCDHLSHDNISINQHKAANYIEFNKKIYEKQIQYGIYFMLGRCKDSPKTEQLKLQYLKEYFKRK